MGDIHYMQRAINLAVNGLRRVSPNPMVGCVIVHNNKIIGEGWHKAFGEAHAEVNAIGSVKEKALIGESIVYITLEPCSFHGKTPACTDLLIKHRPKTVVIACKDPNPKVSGNGINILQDAGIDVRYGILEKDAMALNKRFFVSMREKRPYIILKWAQTNDGFIARKNYDAKWISNEYSRQLVHKWRTEEDGILVGFNTVKYDNPKLTARSWSGPNPIRIVIDPNLELQSDYNLFVDDEPAYIINTIKNADDGSRHFIKVNRGSLFKDMFAALEELNIGSLLVEGGAHTLNTFLNEELWDEARVFTSENNFGDGIKAPLLEVDDVAEQNIMGDRLKIIYNPETVSLWQKN